MTTSVLLIRHGQTDAVGRMLTGRRPGVRLNTLGLAQAARLPQRLAGVPLDAIYASPLERAHETAAPLAGARGLTVLTLDAATEVDFGDWSGMTFSALEALPEWRHFNTHRSSALVPGGERAIDVQARIVGALEELRVRHPGEQIVLVSHADVIRAAVLHVLGVSLDLFHRIEISPASVTALALSDEAPRVLYINERDREPDPA